MHISKTFFCGAFWKKSFLKKNLSVRKSFTHQIWKVKDLLNKKFRNSAIFNKLCEKKWFKQSLWKKFARTRHPQILQISNIMVIRQKLRSKSQKIDFAHKRVFTPVTIIWNEKSTCEARKSGCNQFSSDVRSLSNY